ncbi:hypothetical protein LOCC1_G001434 [Lachnellula occidentalis]|uniref:GPI-anchored protein n=1 Tax=Lachnellula occidentalis TaxID=215460 RepID=A0A8H8UJF8_9HELO|nr:hypothetical protein LOCC1_G001434 [Lachnellula occidentalis]
MRSQALATLFLLPISALQIPSLFASFYEPHTESLNLSNETLISSENESHDLLKRDGSCPANFDSCTTLNAKYGGACCTAGSVCTTDRAKNIACCPTGATCTGTIAAATAASTTGAGGAAVLGGGTATTTGSSSSASITGAASYPSNAYFPFPYIATSYSNSAACNTAFQACQTNYAACTADLQGGVGSNFAVTIIAPSGAGVTVSPSVQSLGSASATSICSSLSSAACFNIQSSNCAQFGSGQGGSFVISSTAGKNGAGRARQTVGCMAAAGVVAGMGLGIAGQIV